MELTFPKLKIHQHAKLPKGVAGRCSYKQNWIKLDLGVGGAKEALVTLAHEGGHYFSYIRNKDITEKHYEEHFTRSKREDLAYLYGWGLLKLIGATSLVTKAEWRYYHEKDWGG